MHEISTGSFLLYFGDFAKALGDNQWKMSFRICNCVYNSFAVPIWNADRPICWKSIAMPLSSLIFLSFLSVIPARGEYGRKSYREQWTPAGGQGKKNNITYRNPPRGCGSFLFDTICPYSLYTAKARQIFLFVCTHRTVGAFFVCRKMAASAQRPVCPVAPLPRPTASEIWFASKFQKTE